MAVERARGDEWVLALADDDGADGRGGAGEGRRLGEEEAPVPIVHVQRAAQPRRDDQPRHALLEEAARDGDRRDRLAHRDVEELDELLLLLRGGLGRLSGTERTQVRLHVVVVAAAAAARRASAATLLALLLLAQLVLEGADLGVLVLDELVDGALGSGGGGGRARRRGGAPRRADKRGQEQRSSATRPTAVRRVIVDTVAMS